MKYINTVEVRKRIAELQKNLDGNIRNIENEVGWHQHLGARKVGIVASAIGLLMHKKLQVSFSKEQDVLSTLIRKQNQDGGWPYISNSQNCSNVEATCWAILALHAYNDNRQYDEQITRGKEWLLNQNPSGREDCGWPFRRNGEIRVYVTCFALMTLSHIGENGNCKVEAAIHWLQNNQNKDGGWGEIQGDESSVFFTCYALLALLELDDDEHKFQESINKGRTWLESKMDDISLGTSFLTCRLEMIETETRNNKYRISFFHYVLPFVVLCYEKLSIHNRVFFDSIKLLLDRSKGGIVEHPMLDSSKKRPIWALCDVTIALSSILPDNNENQLIVAFCNRVYKIPSSWLLRKMLKIVNRWVLSIVLITLVVYFGGNIVAQLWKSIYYYLIGQVSPNWATFCMSVCTSIIATVIMEIALVVKKKVLS